MFFIRLLSRLPFPVLYGISDFLFFVSFRLVGYRRKMVWKNLKNAFPLKSDQELRAIERDFYRNLCDYAVETLKILTISNEELAKRMLFKDVSLINKYLDEGVNVLQLASHQFNWEWLLARGSTIYNRQMDFVYQPVNNKFFNDLTLKIRTRFGGHAIRRDEVARETIKRKNILRGICIVADQYPGLGKDKRYQGIFMNQETVFFYGSNQLALMLQIPVVYHEMKRLKRGYYEVTTVEIATPPYPKDSEYVIENYIRAVEKVMHAHPSGYLWSHNRWKKRHVKQNGA